MRWLGWLALAVYFVCGLAYLALRHVVWPNSHYWLPHAEQALSRALGRPIEIAGVRAGFDGLRPSLEIERLSARDDDGTVTMSARRVHAVVSLRSLAIGQLAFARLDLDAPVLRIERLAHRRLRAAGVVFDIDRPGTDGGGLDWLFAQRAITLRDAQLHWVDRISGRELRVEGVQLALGSVGRRHRATLQVPSAPGLGEQLVLAIEVLRPAFSRIGDWRRWNGEVHVSAGQADLAAAPARAKRSTSRSMPRRSSSSKAPTRSESTSSTAISAPPASSTGTTISERERASQVMWPGKACTSSTTTVRRSAAAVPHTPLPNGISRQPSVPW